MNSFLFSVTAMTLLIRHPWMILSSFVRHSWVVLSPFASSPRQFLSRGPQYLKTKEKSKNVDSRLKISGMTEEASPLNGSIIPLSVTPAIFKPLLACPWVYLSGVHIMGRKTLYVSFPHPSGVRVRFPQVRHPWVFLSGVHGFKNQRKKQKRGFPIKDFGNDGGGVTPEWFYRL